MMHSWPVQLRSQANIRNKRGNIIRKNRHGGICRMNTSPASIWTYNFLYARHLYKSLSTEYPLDSKVSAIHPDMNGTYLLLRKASISEKSIFPGKATLQGYNNIPRFGAGFNVTPKGRDIVTFCNRNFKCDQKRPPKRDVSV